MRTRWIVLAGVAAASFFGGGWLLRRGVRAHAAPAAVEAQGGGGSALFKEVLGHVRSYAVDSLDESVLYRLAASGVLDELDDPYATLLRERDRRVVGPGGVVSARGAYLDQDGGLTVVLAVRPGSPAAEAGLAAGDLVLAVDSARVETRRPEEVARLLDQRADTSVRVRVGRAGRRSALWVTISPGPVPPLSGPTATGLGSGIVRLELTRVDTGTATWVARVADSTAGARGLILDLRGTVEGTLEGAVRLAGLFLPPGTAVVTARHRSRGDSALAVPAGPPVHEVPLVVLVDRATAGAAEVVAGALQDHDRALVVGETSFGRGVSLSSYPLGGGLTIQLSTALWLTPSGRTIQRGQPTDSAADSTVTRPEFHTDSGRRVLGGGGIVPDRPVLAEGGEGRRGDPALDLAHRLLEKARSTATLLSLKDG
jgi:carboxyl-terminal processing protease